jgi:glycosyltransferase involved in cell wall biosynthesis
VDKSGAGLVAEPGNPAAIQQAITKLRDDEGLRIAMGSQARDTAAEHIRERIASRVATAIQDLTSP